MRDIQPQSARSYSETLSFDPPKKELFCEMCAHDCLTSLENLRGIRADAFPMALDCIALPCERCNLRTGNLYEVRVGEA